MSDQTTTATTYKIVRHYQDDNRANKTIKKGLSLEEAQAHCQRDDTAGEGWFDGFYREQVR